MGATPNPLAPLLTGKNPEDEDPQVSYKRNQAWSKPGPYITTLSPQDEAEFQKWAGTNPQLVSNELNNKTPDYDVRGRWLAEKQGDPAAKLTMSPFDHKLHASDKWKTPYDAVFSKESMYAKPDAPKWVGNKLIDSKGNIIVDETPRKSVRVKTEDQAKYPTKKKPTAKKPLPQKRTE